MARRPVMGRDRVARYFVGAWRKAPADLAFTLTEVNATTALMVTTGGRPMGVVALAFDGPRIADVRIIATVFDDSLHKLRECEEAVTSGTRHRSQAV